jgi:Zn-dependent membrane protease YugP
MLGYFDPVYLRFLLPALLLAGIATLLTQSAFSRYARVGAASGLTGAQAARRLLDMAGVSGVEIEPTHGFLGDHYDPRTRTLRLSPGVYGSNSLSAVGVACHEAGHALQHAGGYGPLALRSALAPATQLGSHASYVLFVIGLMLQLPALVALGVLLFGAVVLFSLVTLPVEWNASSRAKRLMVEAGIVSPEEQPHAAAVLNAAFLTYVASAFTAVMTLLYYLARAGFLGRRDD